MAKDYDPDELVGLDMEPEQAIKAILDGAGTEGQEVEMDPEEPDTES